MIEKAYMERIALALEQIALAQERVANHLDKQEEEGAAFRAFVSGAVHPENYDPPGPKSAQAGDVGMDTVVEKPHVLDWFVDTTKKERPIMVRLSDGTERPPTPNDAAMLK